MIRGIYSAASGMISQQIANDNLADNLANISTTAFKRRSTVYQSFPDMMLNRMSGGQTAAPEVGKVSTGVEVSATAIDFSQGALRQTGNPLDVALSGQGFFAVQSQEGKELYTRNGGFTLSPEGQLVTASGELVLDEGGGEITVPPEAGPITINQDGTVHAARVGQLGKLKIVAFEQPGRLEKIGNSLYSAGDQQPVDPEAGRIKVEQGYLEQPNTNVVWEMIQSITGVRAYEALQKTIQQQNQTLGKAVNEVGRPGG